MVFLVLLLLSLVMDSRAFRAGQALKSGLTGTPRTRTNILPFLVDKDPRYSRYKLQSSGLGYMHTST
jgi:hypothetical protein